MENVEICKKRMLVALCCWLVLVVGLGALGFVEISKDSEVDFQRHQQQQAYEAYDEPFLWVIDGETFRSDQVEKIVFERIPSGFNLEPESARQSLRDWIIVYYDLHLMYGGDEVLDRGQQYNELINYYSKEFGYDPDFVKGWAGVESEFIVDDVSHVGAKGLFQIYKIPPACKKQTLAHLEVDYFDPFDPEHSIVAGMYTLSYYTEIRQNNLFLGLVGYVWGPFRSLLENADNYSQIRYRDDFITEAKIYPIKIMALALVEKVRIQKNRYVPYSCQKIYNSCRQKAGEVKDKNDRAVALEVCEAEYFQECKPEEKINQEFIRSIELPGLDY